VVLQAGKSERTARRLGYWSGYYSQALVTRVGKIALRVPQDRQGRFRTDLLERYQSSEKSLCGGHDGDVFTRGLQPNVKIITEELWGHESSSSRSAASFSNSMKTWTSLPGDAQKSCIRI
jgi:transposase-like protein